MSCLGATLAFAAGGAAAQPRLTAQAGPTVAESGSAFYRFKRQTVDSEDGKRHYDVVVGVPVRRSPPHGFAAVYMLDGGAAIETLDEDLLGRLDASDDPPVLVAIGYVGQPRFDVIARAYDDTPPDPATPGAVDDQGRPGGGAAGFLRMIETRIKPLVARQANIDPRRQTLWGHSYGGLFVLYAASRYDPGFRFFSSADPALWWNYGSGLRAVEAFAAKRPKWPRTFSIMVGTNEMASRPGKPARLNSMRASVPPDAARELARQLNGAGYSVRFLQCPGADHGDMFRISLIRTLLDVARAPAGSSPSCKVPS